MKPILEFKEAVLPGLAHPLTLSLLPGSLVLIRLEAGHEQLPLADAAEGLLTPTSGTVLWCGTSWTSMSPHAELAARAVIGRIFEKNSWISNLNVNENVTLSQRHHTQKTESAIITEAAQLAAFFGLPEVPRQRPAFVSKRDLKIAEWIRALLGNPLLLLLERPENGVPDNYLPRLATAIQTALKRGATAIWLTDRDQTWNNPAWIDQIRYSMKGSNLLLVKHHDTTV